VDQLKKGITPIGLTMIAVGSCIGSGIFKTPSQIAGHLPYAHHIFLVWTLGGLVALTGALTFAELSSRFPKTGGVYIFLKESFGDLTAFLYGWIIFSVVTSGALAALAMVFAEYFQRIFPSGDNYTLPLAIGAIVVTTAINAVGVDKSDAFAKLFTGLKILGVGLIIVAGVAYSVPENGLIESEGLYGIENSLASAYALALIGVFFSFGGWHHASYVAGEVRNAAKVVPRAMIAGALIVTFMYLLANYGYLRLLTMNEMSQSSAVATDALNKVSTYGGIFIALLIVISTFGSIGIYTLSAPRIYFKMAEDGMFFPFLAKIHPKHKTPLNAMIFQSGWAILLLLLWGTFESLITYVVFMDWVFMTLAGISLYILRKKMKTEAGFKVPLYPILPLIFILINSLFIFQLLKSELKQAYAGIALLILGLPIYYFFKKRK
jgi:APA family basic amino acid/polyamine antiporter